MTQVIGELLSARAGNGVPVPYDELPITQGVASLLADVVGGMDLYPVDQSTGTRIADRFAVLEQPNPEEDRGETVHKIVQALFWTGNAEALNGPRDPSTGAVDAITVLNPDSVGADVDPADDLRISGWYVQGEWYARNDLTHWKLNDDPRRGPMGKSPLQRCATALDTYGWAYRYLADFFANGGNPGSVIKSKMELPPDKIAELGNEWIAARRHKRPAFLPNWLDLEIPNSSGELQQVIAVLGFAAAEVARSLNLPVSLVNAPVQGYSLQYSNVGDEFRRWLATSLGTTWIARLERGFSTLLPYGVAAKMDPSGLYRADLFPEAGVTELPAPVAPAIAEAPL